MVDFASAEVIEDEIREHLYIDSAVPFSHALREGIFSGSERYTGHGLIAIFAEQPKETVIDLKVELSIHSIEHFALIINFPRLYLIVQDVVC